MQIVVRLSCTCIDLGYVQSVQSIASSSLFPVQECYILVYSIIWKDGYWYTIRAAYDMPGELVQRSWSLSMSYKQTYMCMSYVQSKNPTVNGRFPSYCKLMTVAIKNLPCVVTMCGDNIFASVIGIAFRILGGHSLASFSDIIYSITILIGTREPEFILGYDPTQIWARRIIWASSQVMQSICRYIQVIKSL